jgi:hypothetical protein
MELLGGALIAAGVLHVASVVGLAWRQSRRPSWRIESIAVLAGGGAAWAAVTRVMPAREAVAVTVGVAFVMVVYGVARRRDLRVPSPHTLQ